MTQISTAHIQTNTYPLPWPFDDASLVEQDEDGGDGEEGNENGNGPSKLLVQIQFVSLLKLCENAYRGPEGHVDPGEEDDVHDELWDLIGHDGLRGVAMHIVRQHNLAHLGSRCCNKV